METGKKLFDKIVHSLSQEFVDDLEDDYIPDKDEVSNDLEDFMNSVYPYVERLDKDDKDLLVEYLQKSADYDREEYDDEIEWITDNINSAVSVEVEKLVSKMKKSMSSINLEKVIRVAVREVTSGYGDNPEEWYEDGVITFINRAGGNLTVKFDGSDPQGAADKAQEYADGFVKFVNSLSIPRIRELIYKQYKDDYGI